MNKIAAIQQLNNQNGKQMNFATQMLVIFGVETVKTFLLGSLTASLGPLGTAIAFVAADIVAGIIEDYLCGYDPFESTNFIQNVAYASIGLIGKSASVKRWNKSYLRSIANAQNLSKADKKILYQLNEELISMSFETGSKEFRNYQKIYKKYAATGIFERIKKTNLSELHKKIIRQKKFQQNFKKINRKIRWMNKAISWLDPRYATKEFTNFLTKNLKKEINLQVKSWWKNLQKQKWFKKYEKILNKKRSIYKTLIPLNHIAEPWIMGIKITPSPGMVNRYNIKYIFDKDLTNNKKPVFVYNKTYFDVVAIIKAKSAGQHYIFNVAWGWDIGRAIRENYGINTKLLITSFLPYISRTAKAGISTIKSLTKLKRQIQNLDKTLEKWKNPNNYLKGVKTGAMQGVKNLTLVKSATNFFTTGDQKYLKNYAKIYVRRSGRNYYGRKIKKITKL